MLKFDKEIQLTLNKGEPKVVGVVIVSEFDKPKVVTVMSHCGCTTSKPTFTIEPYDTYVNQFTITRNVSGEVNINFVTDGIIYPLTFKISLNN